MRIILDKASTLDENKRNNTRSKPTVLEVSYDDDRDAEDNILLELTAEGNRVEIENGKITIGTCMTAAEFADALSKLVIFATVTTFDDGNHA